MNENLPGFYEDAIDKECEANQALAQENECCNERIRALICYIHQEKSKVDFVVGRLVSNQRDQHEIVGYLQQLLSEDENLEDVKCFELMREDDVKGVGFQS